MARQNTLLVAACSLVALAVFYLALSDRDVATSLPTAAADQRAEVPAAAMTVPGSSRVAAPDGARNAGWYSAAVGTRLCYAFRMVADLELRDEAGQVVPSTSGRTEIDAAMTLSVLARRGDEALLRLSFDARTLKTARKGKAAEAYRRLLEDGVDVRATADGEITGLRFAGPSISDDRNLVRGLLTAIRFVVPGDASGSWESSEPDLTGDALARYQMVSESDGAEVRRQIRGYAAADGTPAPTATGQVVAHFSRQRGWWTSIAGREQRSLPLPGVGLTARETWTLDVRLASTERAAVSSSNVEWEGTWLPLAPAEASELARSQDEAARRAAVAGLDLDDAMQPVLQLLAADGGHSAAYALALRLLADLLKFDSNAASELGRRLVGGEYPAAVGSPLLSALGMAGQPACQAALADVLAAGPAQDLREAAARAMAQLAEPNTGTLEALWRTCDHTGELGSTEVAALASLASLAERSGSMRQQTEQRLLAFVTAGRGATATASWLEALGQAGITGAGEIAGRYLAGGDVLARHAAVGALSKLHGAKAQQMLRDAALGDAESAVRARALGLLARRGAMDVVGIAARSDPDERVRKLAASLLPES